MYAIIIMRRKENVNRINYFAEEQFLMTAVKNNRDNYIFKRKDLVKIILPLIFQQLLTVMVGAVDTMMVAYAGESAVSGVSLVNTFSIKF